MTKNTVTAVVRRWLEGTTNEIVTVSVDGQLVAVSVEGAGDLKSVRLLEDELEAAIKHPVIVRLRVISAKLLVSERGPSP